MPFKGNKLELPVYNLIDGEFSGEIAGKSFYIDNSELDSKYFNQALRRDIVSRVFHYFNTKGIKKTHVAKTVADVQGSGKKPVP